MMPMTVSLAMGRAVAVIMPRISVIRSDPRVYASRSGMNVANVGFAVDVPMVFLLVRWNATRGVSGLLFVYGRNVPGWRKSV
jgi:hypothetical protein